MVTVFGDRVAAMRSPTPAPDERQDIWARASEALMVCRLISPPGGHSQTSPRRGISRHQPVWINSGVRSNPPYTRGERFARLLAHTRRFTYRIFCFENSGISLRSCSFTCISTRKSGRQEICSVFSFSVRWPRRPSGGPCRSNPTPAPKPSDTARRLSMRDTRRPSRCASAHRFIYSSVICEAFGHRPLIARDGGGQILQRRTCTCITCELYAALLGRRSATFPLSGTRAAAGFRRSARRDSSAGPDATMRGPGDVRHH